MLRRIRHLVILACMLVGIGCGGGTRGSGGQLYDGFVGDESQRALSGVTVTLLESGDSAVSDQSGRFTIKTENLSGTITFVIEGVGISTELETEAVPDDAVRIEVTIKIPSGGKPGASVEIEVKERRNPGVKPTGRPSGEDEDVDQEDEDGQGSVGDVDEDNESGGDDSDQGEGGDSHDEDDSGNNGEGSGGNDDNTGTDSPHDGDKRDVKGLITSISSSSVTISELEFIVTPSSEFRNLEGREASLSDFSVGSHVRARGFYQSGRLLLERLEEEKNAPTPKPSS